MNFFRIIRFKINLKNRVTKYLFSGTVGMEVFGIVKVKEGGKNV